MREIRVTDLDPDNLDPDNFCSSGLVVHPAVAMFPLMEGKEFELFCSDIQPAGLNNPIVMQGDVLSGWPQPAPGLRPRWVCLRTIHPIAGGAIGTMPGSSPSAFLDR
jgi:hypothetical protein